jgi:uncharacterized membrane protein YvbJ
MKTCSYCGRENEEGAEWCHECGTELRPSAASHLTFDFEIKAFLRQPAHIAWLAAGIVLVQGFVRLTLTPHDASLGDGYVERVQAAIWLWGSTGIATVLVCLGLYLRSRRKGHDRGV